MTDIALGVGSQVTRDLSGRFVFIMESAGPVQIYGIFADRSEEGIELGAREQGRFERRFIGLRIINQHSAPQTITIKVSDAQYFPRQDGGAVTIAGQAAPLDVDVVSPVVVENAGGFGVVVVPGGAITTPAEILPDVTGATIPANADRVELILKVDPANAGLIWLSGAAGTGLPLQAGDPPLRLKTDAAVNLIAANNTDKIYYMEILE